MRLDDICSPGFIPNSHTLRREIVKAIGFIEISGSSQEEKALEFLKFLGEASTKVTSLLPQPTMEEKKNVGKKSK